jgi:hypothetical protein
MKPDKIEIVEETTREIKGWGPVEVKVVKVNGKSKKFTMLDPRYFFDIPPAKNKKFIEEEETW